MRSDAERLPPGKLEIGLLREFLAGCGAGDGVVLGPGVGRDVAVVDAGGNRYWLLKSDPVTFATDEIAHYAVTVNANDIATAGGTPRVPGHSSAPEAGITRGRWHRSRADPRACGRCGVTLGAATPR
jgi:hypothetical protein